MQTRCFRFESGAVSSNMFPCGVLRCAVHLTFHRCFLLKPRLSRRCFKACLINYFGPEPSLRLHGSVFKAPFVVSGICWARSRLHTCVEKLLPRALLQAMASAERKGSGGDEGYLKTPLTPEDLPEATEEELPEPVRLLPQGLCRVFSVHSNQVQQASQNESDFFSVIRCVAAPLQSVAWEKEVLCWRNQSGRVLPGFCRRPGIEKQKFNLLGAGNPGGGGACGARGPLHRPCCHPRRLRQG